MKVVYEHFTDEEHAEISERRKALGMTWRQWIMRD